MVVSFLQKIVAAGLISDLHKGVQKACVELRDIAGHMKAMRKRMEEEERVRGK